MKRKEWYSELNLVVAKIFVANNVNQMVLADVKNQLMSHDDIEHLNECYSSLGNIGVQKSLRYGAGEWRFYDHDDRFVNNLKNVADFEIGYKEIEGRRRRVVTKK
jgi:hypothetical protein